MQLFIRKVLLKLKQIVRQHAYRVTDKVSGDLLASGGNVKYDGERREMTVLFANVRGFVTFCENHEPEVVVQQLNEYLSAMTEVILRNQGMIDKFIGDRIMALFGVPMQFNDHATKACIAACEMIAELCKLQKQWSRAGKESFEISIGINTGTMIVGNFGSKQRWDYTAIGDEVNLGSHLEDANKEYGTSIIISESTYDQVKGKAQVRELDLLRIKGKQKAMKIYELRGMEPLPEIEKDLLIDTFHAGLEHYRKQEWDKALREFRSVLHYFPTDGPSLHYVARILDYMKNPSPN